MRALSSETKMIRPTSKSVKSQNYFAYTYIIINCTHKDHFETTDNLVRFYPSKHQVGTYEIVFLKYFDKWCWFV